MRAQTNHMIAMKLGQVITGVLRMVRMEIWNETIHLIAMRLGKLRKRTFEVNKWNADIRLFAPSASFLLERSRQRDMEFYTVFHISEFCRLTFRLEFRIAWNVNHWPFHFRGGFVSFMIEVFIDRSLFISGIDDGRKRNQKQTMMTYYRVYIF